MNALCCENGIDFATESTKSTKDCRIRFFFAVFVFFVARNPFGRQFVMSDSAGAVAEDGFDPQKRGNPSGSLSVGFAWSAVKGLLASVLRGRMSQVGYRSVTLGNGSVLADGAFFRHRQRARSRLIALNRTKSDQVGVNRTILKHFYFIFCTILPRFWSGFLGQISTDNIGNAETFVFLSDDERAVGRGQTGNWKHFAFATLCSSTL